jgi:hypothetical protein
MTKPKRNGKPNGKPVPRSNKNGGGVKGQAPGSSNATPLPPGAEFTAEAEDIQGRKVPLKFRVPKHGKGILRTGNPGPRDTTLKEFRRAWAEAIQDPQLWDQIMADLTAAGDKAGNLRAILLRLGAAYAHGLPPQTFRLTGESGGPIDLAVVRAELTRKITGAAS